MKYPGLFVIGLTGGIATGKSTVAQILAEMGAEVIDADRVSHEVVEPGTDGWKRVVESFGEGILRADGSIDRRKLGDLVFRDKALLDKLNSIVHPLVMAKVRERLRQLCGAESAASTELPGAPDAAREGLRLVVLDVPLLFEAGAEEMVDEVWVVSVDRETQVRRLMERSGYSRAEAELRISSQWPVEEKEKRADVVIDNRGDPESTRRQVLKHLARVERKMRGSGRPARQETFKKDRGEEP